MISTISYSGLPPPLHAISPPLPQAPPFKSSHPLHNQGQKLELMQAGLWKGPGQEKKHTPVSEYRSSSVLKPYSCPSPTVAGRVNVAQNYYLGFSLICLSYTYSPQNQPWGFGAPKPRNGPTPSLPQTRSTKKILMQRASIPSIEQNTHSYSSSHLVPRI